MCSFLLIFLLVIVAFTSVQDFATGNLKYPEAQGQAPEGICKKAVVFASERENLPCFVLTDSNQESFHQAPFKRFLFSEQDCSRNSSKDGSRRSLSMGLPVWATEQEISGRMCSMLGSLDQRQKTRCHSETKYIWRHLPVERILGQMGFKLGTVAEMGRLGRNRKCEAVLSVTERQKSMAGYSLSATEKCKRQRKRQVEKQGNVKGRSIRKPIWPGKRWFCAITTMACMECSGAFSVALPGCSVWEEFHNAGDGSAFASRYKEKETIPSEVQAFLEKADKEYTKNNIKSLHAATKSLDHAQKALREAVEAKKDHRLQWTKHVGEGIKIWEAQLESYRVHQATLSEHASRARLEIEASRKILKEVSDSAVKEGNLSIPQPIMEEAEDANADNVDHEEQKLRDQLQGVLKACAGSLGLQAGPSDTQVQEVSDEDKETVPHHKRPRSVEPAMPGGSVSRQ